MNMKNIEFYTGAVNLAGCPKDNLPWLALAGRSNVGKSSLINSLAGRKKLARVANTPGKTAMLNFYKTDDFYIVDLPGYGYAAVSKAESLRWAYMMEDFFANAQNLRAALLILDARRIPSADDRQMMDYLTRRDMPFGIIANKADKLNKSERKNVENELASFADGQPVVFCSAWRGENIAGVKELINKLFI